jgi:hypothetical protein
MYASRFSASAFALLVAALLVACAQNAPYHTSSGSPGNCRTAPNDTGCTDAYYQEHASYDLAFAEFSDRGNAFNNNNLKDILQRVRDKANEDGVVLITFIHGWKHNASESDDNVQSFKRTLETVSTSLRHDFSGELGRRRLIGLYIGWRGASLTVFKSTSFWDRKAAAEEVGKGGVTQLLLELDKITASSEKNVMVVVGHSFGGAILVSALNEVLTERTVNRTRTRHYARTIGDGVLVLNPAIEANQALSFVETAIENDYQTEQYPLFVSLSSDADSATHYAFPLGQTAGLLLTWRQADLDRSYYYDRLHPEQTLPMREEHLDTTTVGNFAPFLTHRLTATARGDEVDFRLQTCDESPQACEPTGLTSLSGQPAIRQLPQNYPLYFIKTDASVMSGHNDIFNPRVRSFVFTLIDDVVRRKLAQATLRTKGAPEVSPRISILDDPEALEERLQTIYRKMTGDKSGQAD